MFQTRTPDVQAAVDQGVGLSRPLVMATHGEKCISHCDMHTHTHVHAHLKQKLMKKYSYCTDALNILSSFYSTSFQVF